MTETVTERIKALSSHGFSSGADLVSLTEVLEIVEGTIPVKIDASAHDGEPESDMQRLTWEVLDTCWNLLREYGVRLALAELRERATEAGLTPPSDEELFAALKESGSPGAPTGYLDLAVDEGDTISADLAANGLYSIFQLLAEEAFTELQEALEFVAQEDEAGND